VVNALCHSTDIYVRAECFNPSLSSNLIGFSEKLQNEEVNGWTLLNFVDSRVLEEGFQLKTLGQRCTVLEVIKFLRGESATYQRKNGAQVEGTTMVMTRGMLVCRNL
jgi:hypothetical protein